MSAGETIWTDDNLRILREGFEAGRSYGEIAAAVKAVCSRSAVAGKLKRLGLRREPLVGLCNGARTKTRRVQARDQSPPLATVVRNMAARKPDKPLPSPKAGNIALNPRPWGTRRYGECAYPHDGQGADTRSCCNPTGGPTYCSQHAKVMFTKPATEAQRKAAAKARQVKAMRRAA